MFSLWWILYVHRYECFSDDDNSTYNPLSSEGTDGDEGEGAADLNVDGDGGEGAADLNGDGDEGESAADLNVDGDGGEGAADLNVDSDEGEGAADLNFGAHNRRRSPDEEYTRYHIHCCENCAKLLQVY